MENKNKSFLDKKMSGKIIDIETLNHGGNPKVHLRAFGEWFCMFDPDDAEEIGKALIEASRFAKNPENKCGHSKAFLKGLHSFNMKACEYDKGTTEYEDFVKGLQISIDDYMEDEMV